MIAGIRSGDYTGLIVLFASNPIVSMAEFGGPHFFKPVVVINRAPYIQVC
jgi:hypothetical protein